MDKLVPDHSDDEPCFTRHGGMAGVLAETDGENGVGCDTGGAADRVARVNILDRVLYSHMSTMLIRNLLTGPTSTFIFFNRFEISDFRKSPISPKTGFPEASFPRSFPFVHNS